MIDAFPLLSPAEAEEWTMSVPEGMVTALAGLTDAALPDKAGQCASVTAEELQWSAEDFQEVLEQLRALARRAVEQGKSMFLWNCL